MIHTQNNRLFNMLAFLLIATLLLAGASPAAAAKKAKPVRVKAAAGWVDTKVWVEAGQKVNLTTKGKAITAPSKNNKSKSGPAGQTWWDGCGLHPAAPPPCALYNAPYGALVGRIGSGAPFLIGASKSFVASSSGYLWLAVNDNLVYYKDNKGGYTVQFK